MSRQSRDSAMLLNVIARTDSRDWHALSNKDSDYTQRLAGSLKGKRIAFSPRLGHVTHMSPEIEAAVGAATRVFADLGAVVEQIDPPGGDTASIFRTLWWAGAAFLLCDLPEEKKALLDPGLRQVAEAGAAIPLRDYLTASAARSAYGSAMRQFMETYDFILTPSVATVAFDTGELTPLEEDGSAWVSWTPFSFPFNLTQQPAASMPCGFTEDDLPIGLQIVGRMFDDAGVLSACAAYEAVNPLHRRAPGAC